VWNVYGTNVEHVWNMCKTCGTVRVRNTGETHEKRVWNAWEHVLNACGTRVKRFAFGTWMKCIWYACETRVERVVEH
jgi:hypothetical protein